MAASTQLAARFAPGRRVPAFPHRRLGSNRHSSRRNGGFTFSLGVQNRVMTRTNYATYDARNGRAASRHDDLMVIYEEGGQLKADYFDSERHVIRYLVEPRGDHDVMFVSDAKPSDPRYRLRYTARNDGTLAGRFEIAAPGTPDALTP